MPRKRTPIILVPNNERLDLLLTIAAKNHVSSDQLGRWRKLHKLEPKTVKLPGRTGQRLTCDSWFMEFLAAVDIHARSIEQGGQQRFPITP